MFVCARWAFVLSTTKTEPVRLAKARLAELEWKGIFPMGR